MNERRARIETLVAQALGWIEPHTRAIVPPIHVSSTYERAPDGTYPGGHTYTRDQNPTYDQAEALLAEATSLKGVAAVATESVSAHRWRFALASEPLETGAFWLPDLRLAIAGDWCAGSRIEGAFLSGLEAGKRMAACLDG